MVNTVVQKVCDLLADVEDLEVLEQCKKVVCDRYEVVTSSSSGSDKEVSFDSGVQNKKKKKRKKKKIDNNPTGGDCDVTKFVKFMPSINLDDHLISGVKVELDTLNLQNAPDSDKSVVYRWLSCPDVLYKFGKWAYRPTNPDQYPAINTLMRFLNDHNTSSKDYNSCLIAFYKD